MKKNIMALCMALFAMQYLWACDVCGGIINSNTGSLQTAFRYNLLGLNFMTRKVLSAPREQSFYATDKFQSIHLNSQFFIHPKWRIMANIGFQQNNRKETGKANSISGFTDAQVLLSRIIIDQKIGSKKRWNSFVELGLGTSIPTGQYDANIHNNKNLPAEFNIGRGSWGPNLRLNSVLRRNSLGLFATLSHMYMLKTDNGYRFGPSYSLSMGTFYAFKYQTFEVSPSLVLLHERKGKDTYANEKVVLNSSYSISFLRAGIQGKHKRCVLGVTADIPVKQNNESKNLFLIKPRLSAQLSIIINPKKKKK